MACEVAVTGLIPSASPSAAPPGCVGSLLATTSHPALASEPCSPLEFHVQRDLCTLCSMEGDHMASDIIAGAGSSHLLHVSSEGLGQSSLSWSLGPDPTGLCSWRGSSPSLLFSTWLCIPRELWPECGSPSSSGRNSSPRPQGWDAGLECFAFIDGHLPLSAGCGQLS